MNSGQMQTFQATNFQIGYALWGNPSDPAALFFHGFPGSCLQAGVLARFVAKKKVFVIAADRPGYGSTVGRGSRVSYLRDLELLMLGVLTGKNFLV